MSKISFMGVGGFDPIAQTKRVVWRPVSTGTALKIGDPVCYCKDAQDYKERTTNPITGGTTYAEGAQTYNGRLFVVEEPLIDNIDQFAGIVKNLGSKDGADGDFIEIYTANSGAIVPANVVLTATTVGRTLLSVMVGTRTLGSPTSDIPAYGVTAGSTDSKVIGIAMETLTAAGLCWVKLDENNFIHQGGNIGNEFVVAAVADDVTVNQMNVSFANTQDHCQLLHYRAKLTGIGDVHASRGIFRFDAILDHTGGESHIYGIDVLMDIGDGVTTPYLAPLKATLRTRSEDPDLSGAHGVACLMLEYIMTKTTTSVLTNPPPYGALIHVNSDDVGTTPKYLFFSDKDLSLAVTSDDIAAADTAAKSILIRSGGVEYHIPIYTDAEIA